MSSYHDSYFRLKNKLLDDVNICVENKNLFGKFFEIEEYKLKRINGISALDEPAYRTLTYYCSRLRTVNKWFANKPWVDLTAEDIKDVYDRVEDGKMLTNAGKPFEHTSSYYNRVLKAEPFRLAGKAELAKSILNKYGVRRERKAVRYIEFDDFKKLVPIVTTIKHKFLLWLMWDIGENIGALLQLRKRDFSRQINQNSNTPEYIVNLRREILKRSRKERSEITNFQETSEFADIVLRDLSPDDFVFPFEYRSAKKFLDRAVEITGIRCKPNGDKVSWKDLRSGMACYLFNLGWSLDEVNMRLGHAPSSSELDAYINIMAANRKASKQKFEDNHMKVLDSINSHDKQLIKLQEKRISALTEQLQGVNDSSRDMRSANVAERVLNALTKDPACLSVIAKAIAKQGLHSELSTFAC